MVYITLIERKDIMKKKMGIKRWVIGVMVLFLCLPSMSMANQRTRIVFNGRELKLDTPAVVEQGTTLVPLRNVFEAFGAKTHWDAKTRSITATMGETTIWLQVNNKTAKVGNKQIKLNVPAKIKNGYTLVPLRFISEAFGVEPIWNAKTRTITIGGEEKAKSNEIKISSRKDSSGQQYLKVDLKGSVLEHKKIGYYFLSSTNDKAVFSDYQLQKEWIEDSVMYCAPWYTYEENEIKIDSEYIVTDSTDDGWKNFAIFIDKQEKPIAFVILEGWRNEGEVKGTVILH